MIKETQQPFLAARKVSKSFAGNRVLSGVSLELRPGQYHALVGENGAGKEHADQFTDGYLPA